MDIQEAMEKRHSVRKYTDRAINAATVAALQEEMEECNKQGNLNIQLVTDEPDAFSGLMARYGRFSNVRNYIALIGKKSPGLEERVGYYGEHLVLKATQLGLDSCWVAASYSKGKCKCSIGPDEKLVCVISLGYGVDHGVPHRNRPMEELYQVDGAMPDWFMSGMKAAMLAPTATNQQKFRFTLNDGKLNAQATGGFYRMVDLGIVKYHFEQGADSDLVNLRPVTNRAE